MSAPTLWSRIPRIALLDLAVVALVLAALNFLLAKQDPGWHSVNPTPWLLLPLLLGARYGFTPGLLTGLLTAAVLGLVRWSTGHLHAEHLTDHAFFFVALPLTGLIAGEVHGLFARRLTAREQELTTVHAERETLAADLALTAEARWQLQERLALLHAETAALDVQLRDLFQPGAGPVHPALLRLLGETAGVTDAAFYEVSGDRLTRIALTGSDEQLPASLALADVEIAAMALRRGTLTTVKEAWDTVPTTSAALLAALPVPEESGVTAPLLLLIHRMDISSVNWNTFARIQTICRWVHRFTQLHQLHGPAALAAPGAFADALTDANRTHNTLRLPSLVATFDFTAAPEPDAPARLASLIGSLLRSTDIATLTENNGQPSLAVLMPFEPARSATPFLQRARQLISLDPALKDRVTARLSETSADAPDVPA